MATIDLDGRSLIAALWTPARLSPLARGAILAIAGSLFVAHSAQITVPFWPVPITGQTFGVLSLGLVCGWRIGASAMLLYLLEGAVGLPFFALGEGGWAVLTGPSGGYLLGYPLAALLVSWFAERGWDRSLWRTVLALLLGNVVLYVPGLFWLQRFYAGPGQAYIAEAGATTAWEASFNAGLLPFLIGDGVKLLLAAALLHAAWNILRRRT